MFNGSKPIALLIVLVYIYDRRYFMKKISILLFAILNFCAGTVKAADHEMHQALKCTRFFSYYERKYNIPRDTLHSIALQESGKAHSRHKMKIVWPWAVNSGGKSYYFPTKRDAVKFVRSQLRKGNKKIDVGCMQVNMMYHGNNFKSVEHALDPRSNIDYAASLLATKYAQVGNWPKAIAHYHSASSRGEKYSKSVFKIASNLSQNKKAIMQYYLKKNRSRRVN